MKKTQCESLFLIVITMLIFFTSAYAMDNSVSALRTSNCIPKKVIESLETRNCEVFNDTLYDSQGMIVHEMAPIKEPFTQTGKSIGSVNETTQSSKANHWYSYGGPPGGYVTGLTIAESNPNLMFAGTQAGGIYRSTDAGASWQQTVNGITTDWIQQIDIDPSSGVVFAAGNNYWFSAYNQGEVFRSSDNGATWTAIAPTTDTWNAVVVSRDHSNIVVIGGSAGIYRSTDTGTTWTFTGRSGTVVELSFDPDTPATMYAGTYGSRIFKSTDEGSSWTVIGGSIANGNIRSVAAQPSSPSRTNTIFGAAYDALSGGTQGIYRSTDAGATWSHVLTANTWRVRVDPVTVTTVWAAADGPAFTGTPGLYKSTDAGTSWTSISLPVGYSYSTFAYQLAISSVANRVYVGLYRGGLLKTADGGANWFQSHTGLSSDYVNSFAHVPGTSQTIYAGTVQAGLWKTIDSGNTWSVCGTGFNDTAKTGQSIVVDSITSSLVFAGGSNSGVWKSTDSGGTWSITGLSGSAEVKSIKIAPSNHAHIWAAISNTSGSIGIWKSTDTGSTWSRKVSNTAGADIAIHPTNSSIVYAAMSTFSGSEAGTVIKTTDGGASWATVYNDGVGSVLFSIVINTVTPSIIYASTYTNNIVKSTDSGATWVTNLGGFEPDGRIMNLTIDPLNDAWIYAAVSDNRGMFLSTDSGANWTAQNTGLWNKSCLSFVATNMDTHRELFTGIAGTSLFNWGDPATPTPTTSPTRTPTRTPTVTYTPSRTSTATFTRTATVTYSPTRTSTATSTRTVTVTITPTRTATRTSTLTPPPSLTPTRTPSTTMTFTRTVTLTPTRTPSTTMTFTRTVTLTPTRTPTMPLTGTPTFTPTITSTSVTIPTRTPTSTPTIFFTNTPRPTLSPTATDTASIFPDIPATRLPFNLIVILVISALIVFRRRG